MLVMFVMLVVQYQQVLECRSQLDTEELTTYNECTLMPDFTSDDSLLFLYMPYQVFM